VYFVCLRFYKGCLHCWINFHKQTNTTRGVSLQSFNETLLSLLDHNDLTRLGMTCTYLQQLADSPAIWRPLVWQISREAGTMYQSLLEAASAGKEDDDSDLMAKRIRYQTQYLPSIHPPLLPSPSLLGCRTWKERHKLDWGHDT